MEKDKKYKKEWPRTITEELHQAWQKLRRIGDPEIMAAELQYSRPVIDKALIYGYVSMPELVDKINSFFRARIVKEKQQATELLGMADSAATTNQ